MRSYALFIALAVLHARAANIPVPEIEKKLPIGNDALDNVSLDNNESVQELVDPANTVKDVENNLRNSIPENVPVKIIEEKPIIKTITINEDSNDYVPDNDDSSNIKRVEIDLKNPGPPQRQEHDSQKPITYSYVDKERAVAAIKQSIEESQNIFNRGIQDVTQRFQHYFANNDELNEVSKDIQNLRTNFDAEVIKISNTINSYMIPEGSKLEATKNGEISSGIKEVENRLKTLQTNFKYGVGMLSEGVELLSILKEEDDHNFKISGKADSEKEPAQTGTAPGTAPENPPAGSSPTIPTISNPVIQFLQNLNTSMYAGYNNLITSVQNFINPNQNQIQSSPSTNSTSQVGFNPLGLFQGINLPQQQGTPPAGTQSDDASTTSRPNLFQQAQLGLQNFIGGFNQGIANLFNVQPQPQATTQPPKQTNKETGQPAADAPAPAGTNSVPSKQEPAEPAKPSEPIENAPIQNAPVQSAPAQIDPIQQIVQNNPIVKGITNAVKKIQGLSNPSKPRDTPIEKSDSKGHGSGGATGDSISGVDVIESASTYEQAEIIPEVRDVSEAAGELNKTE